MTDVSDTVWKYRIIWHVPIERCIVSTTKTIICAILQPVSVYIIHGPAYAGLKLNTHIDEGHNIIISTTLLLGLGSYCN